MKVISVLIFNSMLWSLINSVKNNKNQNELIIVEDSSKALNKIINDGAESSVAAQSQKFKETLNTNYKIEAKDDGGEKKLRKKEYDKERYQKNKEKFKNTKKDKLKTTKNNKEYARNYQKVNKEKIRERKRKYFKNNKDKLVDYKREYRQKKRNEKFLRQDDSSNLKNVQANNGEGTSYDKLQNAARDNKGNEPIKENVQLEQGIVNCVEVEHLMQQIDDDINMLADENFLVDLSFLDDI